MSGLADNERGELFPISYSQNNICGLERICPGTPINNICSVLRINGRIDPALIGRCLNTVLRADSSLRLTLTLRDGQPVQYCRPYEPQSFPFFDFTLTDAGGIARWENAGAQLALPWLDSPLYAFSVFKSGENSGGILLKLHHLIADGWTLVSLANRIADTYLALLSGRCAEPEPLPVYRGHVEREAAYLASPAAERDRAYWRGLIAGYAGERAALKRCGSASVSPAGKRRSFLLSDTLNHAIGSFCAANRVAPFSVFCMALALHLRRMSGCDRMCIGVPVLNRPDFADKNTGGMFVSTLPFFCTADDSLSLEQFNLDITERWYDLLRHQRLPFGEIAALAREAEGGDARLFDIVLSYQDSRIFRSADASMLFSGRWIYSGYQTDQLIIHLTSLEGESRFSVDYDYQTQLFCDEEIATLHGHLLTLLEALLGRPAEPMNRLALLPAEEYEKTVYTFNRTATPPPARPLPDALRAVAAANPGRAALIYEGSRISYRDLFARAERLAAAVFGQIGAGKVVAVSVVRGPETVVGMLAAALSGNAWVILAPELPSARLRDMLQSSGAALLYTDPGCAEAFDGCALPRLCVGQALPENSPAPAFTPDLHDLGYIVYTSGSTGTPKGAQIEAISLLNLAAAMAPVYGRGAVLSVCSQSFDAFLLETAAALLNARTVVMPPAEQLNDPARLAEIITGYSVGFFAVTPSRLRSYLAVPAFAAALRGVESIVCGGEPPESELLSRLAHCTGAHVFNQYGPSETAVGVSIRRIDDSAVLTAGKPMPGCRLYILDANRNPLPIGAIGELYIGGVCVGRGYAGNPEATAAAFSDSPFEPGERLYRSGDRASWSADGELVIAGRLDGQVKLRGMRIELSEIAGVLAGCAGVGETAARVVRRAAGDFIAAYYTADFDLDEADLYDHCAAHLPPYMLPDRFVRLDKLPLTANGKIDTARLPEPEDAPAVAARAPASVAEVVITDVFRRILQNPDLGPDSDYFRSGGDSLNALAAIAEISRLCGRALPVADLHTYKTPARLALRLGDAPAPSAPEPDRIPAARRDRFPLTPIQQSICFQCLLHPDSTFYNMPGAFALPDGVDTERLRAAFTALIAAEPLLRTRFTAEKGVVRMTVAPSAPFALPVLMAESFEQACAAFVAPFDLNAPPLLRAALWQAPDGGQVLFIDTHHLVNDGEGTPILLARLDRLYADPTAAAPPAVSYLDYAAFAADRSDDRRPDDLAYWKKQLDGFDARPLPFAGRDGDSTRGGALEFAAPDALSRRAEEFCRGRGVTPFALVAAVWGVLLYKLTGRGDFAVGTPVSGRRIPETHAMAGAFINTLPLRLRPAPEKTLETLLSEIDRDAADLVDHGRCAAEELIRLAGVPRTAHGTALYNVMLSQRPLDSGAFTLDGKPLRYLPVPVTTAKADLVLELAHTENRFSFAIQYAAPLFDAATVRFYSRSLLRLTAALLDDPTAAIESLCAVSSADRLELCAAPTLRVPYDCLPLDRLVDRVAETDPDRPALRAAKTALTFAELRGRAGFIAGQLLAADVAPGSTVGLCCRRGTDLVCAAFGILKAGCAYLPLSASLPAARVNAMLTVAGAAAVLTDAVYENLTDAQLPCPVVTLADGCEPPENLPVHTAETAAQVLFTSGSTGEPKGVVIRHRSLCNLRFRLGEILAGAGVTRSLASSNILFDSFTLDTILPLTLGLPISVADEDEMTDARGLAARLTADGCDGLFATPSKLQVFLGSPDFAAALGGVRCLLTGGEATSSALAERLRTVCGGQVWNLYGPAEATVFVTDHRLDAPGRPPIGRAIPNVRVCLLDPQRNPLPPGATGELYIGGECLAAGYAGRPDLTDAAFLPDPVLDGERLYKTGDLARRDADGCFTFLGRADSQVKINGQRIETDEVAGAILRTGFAADAAVIAVVHEGVAALHAFVIPAEPENYDETRLRAALSGLLPSYMIPAVIRLTDSIPHTATGKTDLRALAQLDAAPASAPAETAAPADDNDNGKGKDRDEDNSVGVADGDGDPEAALRGFWRDVLGAEPDPDRSFFEQGGSSLGAMNLIIRYFQLGAPLSLEQFYETPTLNAHLALVREALAAAQPQSAPPAAGSRKSPRAQAAQQTLPLVEDKQEPASSVGNGLDRSAAVDDKPAVSLPQSPAATAPSHPQSAIAAGALRGENDSANPAAGKVCLVTGANGFLGAHLVAELLAAGAEKVYCLVRGDTTRLYDALTYYFGADWLRRNARRLVVLTGNVTYPMLGIDSSERPALLSSLQLLFHAAADVRHYAAEAELLNTNLTGTRNAAEFARRAGARLIFISTPSVGGSRIPPENAARYAGLDAVPFTEDDFEIGQNVTENLYAYSKYQAERAVREARETGLDAMVARVGRLVGRASDGKFQREAESNYFCELVRGILCAKAFPAEQADVPFELTPVDCCARACVLLADGRLPTAHVFSPETVTMSRLFAALDPAVVPLPGPEFAARMVAAARSIPMRSMAMLVDAVKSADPPGLPVVPVCRNTCAALAAAGFVWPKADPARVLREFPLPAHNAAPRDTDREKERLA